VYASVRSTRSKEWGEHVYSLLSQGAIGRCTSLISRFPFSLGGK
jgi:hypothetical protein